MNKFHRWIYEENDPQVIIRRSTVWNLAASLINASLTAVILFCLSWTDDRLTAGYFSIASAIAYQVQAIGLFGVRNYHITDVRKKYSFSDYLFVNVFSGFVMIAALVFMVMGHEYTTDKIWIIVTYSLYRAVDIYEALYYDEYQRLDRIDVGLILQTVRFLVTIVILIIVYLLTRSLSAGCIVALVVSIGMVIWQNREFSKAFGCKIGKFNKKHFKALIKICLPICIAGFVSMYLVNSSKYAIDANLNDEVQGIFAILIVPVFTINMLATVIYRPYITRISHQWADRKIKGFVKATAVQVVVIIALTILITLFGYVIGLKLLGMIYHVDLAEYMDIFTILLLGGGMNTLAVFLSQILVIMEEQNANFVIYILAGALTLLLSTPLARNYGMLGASLLYVLASLFLVLFSFVVMFRKSRKVKSQMRKR